MALLDNHSSIGSNDSSVDSIEKDLFEIKQYVDGLSLFIGKCVTPMTVSIQGDWGSGKTSIMNMVRESLADNVIPIWFNTWQYSQFNLGEDLPLSLLGRLLKELKPEQKASARAYDTFKLTYKAMKKAGRIALNQIAGKEALEVLDALASSFVEGNDDSANAIDNLKSAFQECVDNTIKRDGKDRVVIFIDDLDRLNPVKAVELLEVLKIFLDCEHCVFVLAIDYSVVSSGVKEKYGDLIGTDKGRRFFDKIIQVPFKMPVAHYQVRNFIIGMFRQIDSSFREDEADTYVDLIQHSVGCNPRTMKRLFNAYLLLMCIGKNVSITDKIEDPAEGPWYKKLLFATLCCQHAYEELYNFIVRNKSDILQAGILEELKNPASYRSNSSEEADSDDSEEAQGEILAELQTVFRNASDELISRMAEFMELFIAALDRSGDNMLDEEKEIAALEEILSISAITTTGNDEEVEGRTTKWGSQILTGVEDLEMGNLDDEKKREIAEILQTAGEGVQVLFLRGKLSHIVAKGPGGKTFADVYGAKKGYSVVVYAPVANLFTNKKRMPVIVEWVEAHGFDINKLKKSSHPNRLTVKILNEEDEASLKELLGYIYTAWGKYTK